MNDSHNDCGGDGQVGFEAADIQAALNAVSRDATRALATEENFEVINRMPTPHRAEVSALVLARYLSLEPLKRDLLGASKWSLLRARDLPGDGTAKTQKSIELGLAHLLDPFADEFAPLSMPSPEAAGRRFTWEPRDGRPALSDLVLIGNRGSAPILIQVADTGDVLTALTEATQCVLESPAWEVAGETASPMVPLVTRSADHLPHLRLSSALRPATLPAAGATADLRLVLQNPRPWTSITLQPWDLLIARSSMLRRGVEAAYGWFGNVCDAPPAG